MGNQESEDSSQRPVVVWEGLRVRVRDGVIVSSMRLQGPQIPPGFRLELRLDGTRKDLVDRTATPFLPIAAFLGGLLGATVVVRAPVDPVALEGARRSVRVLHDGYGWPEVEIRSTGARARRRLALRRSPVRQGRAVFFSRGVDSLSTLVTHRDEITHLMGVDWVDPPFAGAAQEEVWAATAAAAADFGLPLIRLTSNARDVLDPLISWNDTHGAVLCSLALLGGGGICEAWISSAHPAARAPKAHGNNKALVESWSSSTVRIRQIAGADSRTEKAAIVATDDTAVKWLKVCWEAPGEGNCGVCEKCLLTMSNFAANGTLDRVRDRFRAPLDPAAIRRLDLSHLQAGSVLLVESALDELPDGPVRDAWRDLLASVPTPT